MQKTDKHAVVTYKNTTTQKRLQPFDMMESEAELCANILF